MKRTSGGCDLLSCPTGPGEARGRPEAFPLGATGQGQAKFAALDRDPPARSAVEPLRLIHDQPMREVASTRCSAPSKSPWRFRPTASWRARAAKIRADRQRGPQAQNDLNQVILDDASQAQNPDPILFGRGGLPLSASNTLRGGDTATGIVGVLNYTWADNSASPNAYRVRPINAMGGTAVFESTNPRPTAAQSTSSPSAVSAPSSLMNRPGFGGDPDGWNRSAARPTFCCVRKCSSPDGGRFGGWPRRRLLRPCSVDAR